MQKVIKIYSQKHNVYYLLNHIQFSTNLAYLIYSIHLTFKHTLKQTMHTKYYNGPQIILL